MTTEREPKGLRWLWSVFVYYVKTSWHRYKRLPILGKVSVIPTRYTYIPMNRDPCCTADGHVGPRPILSRTRVIPSVGRRRPTRPNHVRLCPENQPSEVRLVHPRRHARCALSLRCALPRGWLTLYGNYAVVISFPPCIGHTTIVTLCGFAYGMKGFYIAAPASLIGSAAAFVVLRFLFSRRLRKWSSSNEKWQALEAVVVRSSLAGVQPVISIFYRKLRASLSSSSFAHLLSLHGSMRTRSSL